MGLSPKAREEKKVLCEPRTDVRAVPHELMRRVVSGVLFKCLLRLPAPKTLKAAL